MAHASQFSGVAIATASTNALVNRALHPAVAMLLLAAAAMKALQADAAPPADVLAGAWSWGVPLIEAGLAGWLISGLAPRLARLALTLVFAAMTGWSLHLASLDRPDCGCFGDVAVPPMATATLDMVILAACLVLPMPVARPTIRWRRAAGIAPLLIVTALLILPRPGASPHGLDLSGSVVRLDPVSWIGQPLPLAGHIQDASITPDVRWVVLHRQDCPACHTLLDAMSTLSLEGLLLLNVGDGGDEHTARPADAATGRLDPRWRWSVATPTLIRLERGVVLQVARGSTEALRLLKAQPPAAGDH